MSGKDSEHSKELGKCEVGCHCHHINNIHGVSHSLNLSP